jgi:hypothetical protein
VTLDVLFVAATLKLAQCILLLTFYLAVVIAVFLLFVQATAWFSASRTFCAARQAHESVSKFACFAATYAGALARAVQRVSVIFLVVRGHEGFLHGKAFSAFGASERNGGLSFGDFFIEAVRTPACKSAVLPVFTRKTGERLLAIFTDFLNRHRLAPSFGDEGTLLMSIGIVK